jgi:hypothetical protein
VPERSAPALIFDSAQRLGVTGNKSHGAINEKGQNRYFDLQFRKTTAPFLPSPARPRDLKLKT